jgi:hypothetical protein
MTNLQSLAGSFAWMAVAAILMLAAFEPVPVEQQPAAALQIAAQAPSASTDAAV